MTIRIIMLEIRGNKFSEFLYFKIVTKQQKIAFERSYVKCFLLQPIKLKWTKLYTKFQEVISLDQGKEKNTSVQKYLHIIIVSVY